MSKLLEYDPVTKTRKVFHDLGNDEFAVETLQDVEDVVALNQAKYAATDERARWGEMAQVASIPMPLFYDLRSKGIIDPDGDVTDEKAFLRLLDDPAYRKLRTRPGLLSRGR